MATYFNCPYCSKVLQGPFGCKSFVTHIRACEPKGADGKRVRARGAYLVRAGAEVNKGDHYCFALYQNGGNFGWTGDPSHARRYPSREAAEAAALEMLKKIRGDGYDDRTIRVVPAGGGTETGFRPEEVLGSCSRVAS